MKFTLPFDIQVPIFLVNNSLALGYACIILPILIFSLYKLSFKKNLIIWLPIGMGLGLILAFFNLFYPSEIKELKKLEDFMKEEFNIECINRNKGKISSIDGKPVNKKIIYLRCNLDNELSEEIKLRENKVRTLKNKVIHPILNKLPEIKELNSSYLVIGLIPYSKDKCFCYEIYSPYKLNSSWKDDYNGLSIELCN